MTPVVDLLVAHPFKVKEPLYGWLCEGALRLYETTGVLLSAEVLLLAVLLVAVAGSLAALVSFEVAPEGEHIPSQKG